MYRLDSNLGFTPLDTSVHELVRGFDAASEVDVLDGHRDGLERDHE